jgi:hypothetical protein
MVVRSKRRKRSVNKKKNRRRSSKRRNSRKKRVSKKRSRRRSRKRSGRRSKQKAGFSLLKRMKAMKARKAVRTTLIPMPKPSEIQNHSFELELPKSKKQMKKRRDEEDEFNTFNFVVPEPARGNRLILMRSKDDGDTWDDFSVDTTPPSWIPLPPGSLTPKSVPDAHIIEEEEEEQTNFLANPMPRKIEEEEEEQTNFLANPMPRNVA